MKPVYATLSTANAHMWGSCIRGSPAAPRYVLCRCPGLWLHALHDHRLRGQRRHAEAQLCERTMLWNTFDVAPISINSLVNIIIGSSMFVLLRYNVACDFDSRFLLGEICTQRLVHICACRELAHLNASSSPKSTTQVSQEHHKTQRQNA